MSYQPSNRTILISSDIPTFQTAYSSKDLKHSISFPSKSPHTRQEFKSESDINTIMSRYIRTGELPHVNLQAPQYFDSSGVDFQTHMEAVAHAKSLFAQLPSSVRNRFYNDPGQFIDFCSNDSNRVELAKMGLLSPEAARAALYPVTPTPPKGGTAPKPPASAKTPSQSPPEPQADA